MGIGKFLRRAEFIRGAGLGVRPLLRVHGGAPSSFSPAELAALRDLEAAVESDEPSVLRLCREAGLSDLLLDCAGQTDACLAEAFGHCRYVLGSRGELQQLDRVVLPLLRPGYLENVAIRLSPVSGVETDFSVANLPQLSRWLRFSDAVAVRGIFLDLRGAQDLCQAARDAFSLVKKIRSDMPCLFHFFCLEGLLEPLAAGDDALLQTVRMLASLNDTSLYAQFFLQ